MRTAWVVACAVGTAAGWALWQEEFSWKVLLFGMTIGFCQALVITRRLSLLSRWVAATESGWIVGFGLGAIVGVLCGVLVGGPLGMFWPSTGPTREPFLVWLLVAIIVWGTPAAVGAGVVALAQAAAFDLDRHWVLRGALGGGVLLAVVTVVVDLPFAPGIEAMGASVVVPREPLGWAAKLTVWTVSGGIFGMITAAGLRRTDASGERDHRVWTNWRDALLRRAGCSRE